MVGVGGGAAVTGGAVLTMGGGAAFTVGGGAFVAAGGGGETFTTGGCGLVCAKTGALRKATDANSAAITGRWGVSFCFMSRGKRNSRPHGLGWPHDLRRVVAAQRRSEPPREGAQTAIAPGIYVVLRLSRPAFLVHRKHR
jgi:hypothetical protein